MSTFITCSYELVGRNCPGTFEMREQGMQHSPLAIFKHDPESFTIGYKGGYRKVLPGLDGVRGSCMLQ